MKLKSLILAMFLTLGMTFSYANVTSNEVKTNETKNELFFTSTVSNEVTYSINEDDCKWYMITHIHTTNYFVLGYWVGSSVETDTEIKCI